MARFADTEVEIIDFDRDLSPMVIIRNGDSFRIDRKHHWPDTPAEHDRKLLRGCAYGIVGSFLLLGLGWFLVQVVEYVFA